MYGAKILEQYIVVPEESYRKSINERLMKKIVALTPGEALVFEYKNNEYRVWRDSIIYGDDETGVNILKCGEGQRVACRVPYFNLFIDSILEYTKLLDIAEIHQS